CDALWMLGSPIRRWRSSSSWAWRSSAGCSTRSTSRARSGVERTRGPAEIRRPAFVVWSCRMPYTCARCRFARGVVLALTSTDADESGGCDGAVDEELEGVDDAQQHDQVQPTRATIGDESGAPVGDGEVADREQHGRDAPAQLSPGAQGVEQNVGGHPDPHERADAGAGVPDQSEHDGV